MILEEAEETRLRRGLLRIEVSYPIFVSLSSAAFIGIDIRKAGIAPAFQGRGMPMRFEEFDP